jgi:hypothetical protein
VREREREQQDTLGQIIKEIEIAKELNATPEMAEFCNS